MAKRLTISGLAPEVEAKLKTLAEERGVSVSGLLHKMIVQLVKHWERRQAKAAMGGGK